MLVRRGNSVRHATQGSSEGRGPGIVRGGGEAGDPGRSDEISLSDLVRVLRRRKRIIAASVVVVFLLGMVYCAAKTRRYEAVADLAINPEGADALDMGDITASLGGGGLGFDEKLETQVHILKSDSMAWTVISELHLDKQPTFAGYRKFIFLGTYIVPDAPEHIEQTSPERRNQLLAIFSAALTVQTIARTQAVEITFRNANPNLARDIVNHLVSAYTQRTFMTRYNDTMKASDWLSGQLAQLKSAVEQSQSKLSRLQIQTGIFGTDENDNLVLSKLDDLSKELTDAESDRIVKEAKYRVAQSSNPELIGTIVPDSVLPILRGQQADLEKPLRSKTLSAAHAQSLSQAGEPAAPGRWSTLRARLFLFCIDLSMARLLDSPNVARQAKRPLCDLHADRTSITFLHPGIPSPDVVIHSRCPRARRSRLARKADKKGAHDDRPCRCWHAGGDASGWTTDGADLDSPTDHVGLADPGPDRCPHLVVHLGAISLSAGARLGTVEGRDGCDLPAGTCLRSARAAAHRVRRTPGAMVGNLLLHFVLDSLAAAKVAASTARSRSMTQGAEDHALALH
jgi:capsular polysaccharide biosynthesis protein